jgi:hypothetical protein
MIFHAFQREDDDAVFTVVKNVSGGALAAGESVVWDITSSVDGVRVTAPVTATASLFRGIVAEAIADNAYGKVQVHGYCSAAKVSNGTQAIATGTILITATNAKHLVYSAANTTIGGFVYAAEAYASDTSAAVAANKKVLIRAL